MLCVDEKPIQALRRCYPAHISAGGFVREEFEYARKAVRHLLAAFDIRTGRVVGRMVKHRGARELVSFLDELGRRHPGRVLGGTDYPNIPHPLRSERDVAVGLGLDASSLRELVGDAVARLLGLGGGR